MTTEATTTSFVVSIASTACLSGLAIPHLLPVIRHCFSRDQKYQAVGQLYEDEDGQASDTSQAAFSDLVQRLTLIILSIVGVALAVVSAVFTTTQQDPSNNFHLVIQQWLQFASWVSKLRRCLLT